MVSKKPSAKSTKAEILAAYNELAKEKSTIKSQLDQSAKEQPSLVKEQPVVVSKMNQSLTVQQKMNLTIENLEKIQQGFGSAVSDLSDQLTREASKLQEIRRFVATELEQLQSLHNLQVANKTLDNLIKVYENSFKSFGEEFSKTKETLEQEVLTQRKAWVKEQEEHTTLIKERNETESRTRQREGAEYKYDLELQRKINTDEYEQSQKISYDRLKEQRQEQEKQWAEK